MPYPSIRFQHLRGEIEFSESTTVSKSSSYWFLFLCIYTFFNSPHFFVWSFHFSLVDLFYLFSSFFCGSFPCSSIFLSFLSSLSFILYSFLHQKSCQGSVPNVLHYQCSCYEGPWQMCRYIKCSSTVPESDTYM